MEEGTTTTPPPSHDLDAPLLLQNPARRHGKDVEAPPPSRHGGASFARTCLNLTNVVSGIGVLSMPYAVAQGGWLSLLLFAAVGALCCYTGTLIERCMRADGSVRSYPDIGQLAFGAAGRRAIASFMYVELYLVAISFLVIEGDNLDKLFPGATMDVIGARLQGKKLFVFLAAAAILPTTWLRNHGILAYVSAVGLVASVVLTASLVWAGIETGTRTSSRNVMINLAGLPTSLGLYFVCFAGHAVFPTIYSSMNDNKNFSKVLLISSALCSINYALVAVLGYLIYGDDVQSQVTLNLPSGKVYSKIAVVTTLITPLAKYAIVLAPITAAIDVSPALAKLVPSRRRELIGAMVLGSTALLASMVPFFGYLLAFIGSFLNVMVTVMFPCLCYLKIYRADGIRCSELAVIICILLVGVCVAVTATYTSLQQIVSSFR